MDKTLVFWAASGFLWLAVIQQICLWLALLLNAVKNTVNRNLWCSPYALDASMIVNREIWIQYTIYRYSIHLYFELAVIFVSISISFRDFMCFV